MGRWGIRIAGILTLVAAAALLALVPAYRAIEPPAASRAAAIVVVVLMGVVAFLLVYGFLAARGLFARLGYRRGGVAAWTLAFMVVVSAPLAMLATLRPSALFPVTGAEAARALVFAYLGWMALGMVAALMFAAACIGFARHARAGVWIAVGLLDALAALGWLVPLGLIIATLAAGAPLSGDVLGEGSARSTAASIGAVVGAFAGLGGLVCRGIGLILGAARLAPR
jgi:hypothetical protein